VRDTINRVDEALNKLVDKTNELADLNPKYKTKIKVSTTTGGGRTGTSGPSGGVNQPGTSEGPR
jgi:hypothetical protein